MRRNFNDEMVNFHMAKGNLRKMKQNKQVIYLSQKRGQRVTKEKTSSYSKDDITVLEGLEPVRKRPGMYIGTTSSAGLHHLVWEIVDNSVDEALAGFCTKIKVTVHADNSVSVEDNGRGIPVDIYPKKKIPTLEVVLTILHAGGKFDNSAYKVSGGLHGVGVSVVNALSKRMIAEVKRDGKIYQMEFKRGKTTQKMKEIGKTKSTGTTITFWPSKLFPEKTQLHNSLNIAPISSLFEP